jgi:hypothetical protein
MTNNTNMKKPKIKTKAVCLMLLSLLSMSACSDMDEYFEEPDYIAGSIYEKLQGEGNYSQFLKGAEMAGYEPILNGKAILTVMAPDDQAMQSYLQTNYQTQDIGSLPVDAVKKLIGFHILYYSYDKDKLINFRPSEGDGATAEEKQVKAGLYYKFRTRSQDAVEKAMKLTTTTLDDGAIDSTYEQVFVYHPDRFIPVFSYQMFRTKGIDAKQNYTYFFPETGWTADGAFQVANANVIDVDSKENIAKNGYIYKVDRVLRPMETIYTELRNAGKFEKFLSFYDQYKTYEKSTDLTNNFATTDEQRATGLYTVSFDPLPQIANEWPIDDYKQFTTLSHRSYSIFAPTDQAMQNFFDEYWRLGGYKTIDDVPTSQMTTLLLHSIFQETSATKDQTMIFPDEIESGRIMDSDNNVIKFDTQEVPQEDRIVCSNGVLYGCSVLTPPSMFNSVTGPAYQYKKYSTFGTMLSATAANGSGLDKTLSADAISYIMLYPDNDQLANSEQQITVAKGSPATIMNQPPGLEEPAAMSSAVVTSYVNAHAVMATDGNTVLPESGSRPAVYATMQTSPLKVYWFVKDGKITNSIQYLKTLRYQANLWTEDDIWAAFEPLAYRGDINGWTNGHAYTYDSLLFRGSYQDGEAFYPFIVDQNRDNTTEFYGWCSLLQAGGYLSAGRVSFMTESCLQFVPTTQALARAIANGRVPGVEAGEGSQAVDDDFFTKIKVTDKLALQQYLVRYFVPISTAVITNYPYLGWGETTVNLELGGLETLQVMDDSGDVPVVAKSYVLNVFDDGSVLSVQTTDLQTAEKSAQVKLSSAYDFLPLIFSDGVVYFLDEAL